MPVAVVSTRDSFLALLLTGASVSIAAAPVPPLPAPGDPLRLPEDYTLVWSDEFDKGTAPDPHNWTYETQRNRAGWYNGERQYYAARRGKNARVEEGRLIIEAHREDLSGFGLADWSGQRFSSARLTTRGRAAWHHGYFEIRARLPCTVGAWPAIWLLPEHQDRAWQGGEIDVAETVGYEPMSVHHAIQTTRRNFKRGNHARSLSRLDYCGSFRGYQLLWTPDSVVIGVDGKVGFAASAREFDRKMVLILNVAVGGEWAGAKGIDEASFPARMEVESVRVWQKRAAP